MSAERGRVMELRPIVDLRSWYDTELTRAFPANECKPLGDIQNLVCEGRYEPLGFYDGEDLLGYATLWSHPDWPGYVLLDYLGVTAQRRNRGLGARLLDSLRERYTGKALVIAEAETPVPGGDETENNLRLRRIGFYRRCGFTEVYDTGACGARFRALVLGTLPWEMDHLMAAHRAIYGPHRTDVKIPLGADEIPELPYWMK